MPTFRGFRIHRTDGRISGRFEDLTLDDLTPGDVVVRVSIPTSTTRTRLPRPAPRRSCASTRWSEASTSRATIESSADSRFRAGQRVAVIGCGLSETLDGGYAEYARVPGRCDRSDLPAGISPFDAMRIGTAGFTAALGVHRMEQNEQTPVTGRSSLRARPAASAASPSTCSPDAATRSSR